MTSGVAAMRDEDGGIYVKVRAYGTAFNSPQQSDKFSFIQDDLVETDNMN